MAIDHSNLGLENKSDEFLGFDKFTSQNLANIWGWVNQPFILFIHHIWDETVLWGAVFITQTSDRMQYFTVFQDKLHSANIQDDQSWAFTETVQKISKITYTASMFSLLTSAKFAVRAVSSVWVNINRVTPQHNKEFITFFLLFNGFITMGNLKKGLRAHDCKYRESLARLKK